MENLTLTKLALISQRAQREPKCQFTSLAHLLDEGFLKECYNGLGRDRACGIDGVSWKDYGKQLDENIKNLVARMKAKRYCPQPAKRVYIPKDERSKRPLGLPSLEDKIVQKGIARVLEAIYEVDFLDNSYGFRPQRSCHQAISAVDKMIRTQYINHVIEADIKGFFDNMSHAWMMRFLKVRIKDPSFLLLVERFLQAGYIEADQIIVSDQGTPQGGNLSPVLSNIFLHYVLDLWFEKRVKPQARGLCTMVRYADDFVCMTRFPSDAQWIEAAMRERFRRFGLELHPEKTRVISFGRFECNNAERDKRKAHTFDFLGFTHYCGKSRKGKFLVYRKTSAKKFRRQCKALNTWLKSIRNACKIKEWWPILQAKLRGHYQYYGISLNSHSIRRFYQVALHLTLKWLNRRSQRRSFTWQKFSEYLKRYPLPKPYLVHDIYTLSSNA